MNCNRVARLLDAYIDGELDGESMLKIREHLRNCPDCESELKAIRRMKMLVARTLPMVPPTDLEDRLLASCRKQIAESSPHSPFKYPVPTFAGIAFAAAVVTFALLASIPKHSTEKSPETTPIAFEIQRDQIYSVGLDPMAGSPTISTTHAIAP